MIGLGGLSESELMHQYRLAFCGRGPTPLFDWVACGTAAQYRKHLRHGIPACEACLQAERRRSADREGVYSRYKARKNAGVKQA